MVCGKRTVKSEQTVLSIKEMLRANVGAKVHLKLSQEHFVGTIVSIPTRERDRDPASRAASEPAPPPEVGGILIVQTAEGYRVLALDAVQEATFLEQPKEKIPLEEDQNVLQCCIFS